MHESTELSIVIVTWNSQDEIGNCLRSIIESTNELNYEIVIVDNNSKDNTVTVIKSIAEENFHRIKLILNNFNTGYTKASNQGILSSSGKNILLLNPDTVIEKGSVIKKEVLNRIGNFDERFKMFFNDVDLCKRICDAGYDIIFYPESKIIHEKGVSIYKDREKMIRIWNEDCLSYFRKYNTNSLLLVWLGISLKLSGFFRILLYKISK